ncbi:MAG: macro domain-containing protein [Spirochaetales bacterium]
MQSKTISGVTIECVKGDITSQPDLDAVVNAANAQLHPGGGVAGAIHRAAGPELDEICRPLAPIRPGEAVITSACKLPNKYVIHALGPVYGADNPSDTLLSEAYRNSLARAEEAGLTSVGFPALSTGAFGYPMEEAAAVALKTIAEEAAKLKTVGLVRMVLFGSRDVEIHEKALAQLET